MRVARSIWAGVTWRKLLTAQAVALGLAVLEWSNNPDFSALVPPTWVVVHFTLWALSGFFIVPATLRADQAVMRGARPLWAYLGGMTGAVLIALSITTVLACLALGYGRFWSHTQSVSPVILLALYVKTLMDLCFAGGLVLLCRVNQHLARQIAVNLQHAEDRRTTLERRLTDSRLAIAEARMDPAALLRSLAEIRSDLAQSGSSADGKMDELILKLRRAMARTVMASEAEITQP